MMIKWKLTKSADGWEGSIEIPIEIPGTLAAPGARRVSGIAVKAKAKDKAVALGKAATVAKMIEGQMAAHPELAAILPPGTGLALQAISGIAKSALAGKLESALARHTGPAIKRLGKALRL